MKNLQILAEKYVNEVTDLSEGPSGSQMKQAIATKFKEFVMNNAEMPGIDGPIHAKQAFRALKDIESGEWNSHMELKNILASSLGAEFANAFVNYLLKKG